MNTVRLLISTFLIESVALYSKCLLIVIQITRLYIWRWTPGPAKAHGLSGGCQGRAQGSQARPIWIMMRRHFEESGMDSIEIIARMSFSQLKPRAYKFGGDQHKKAQRNVFRRKLKTLLYAGLKVGTLRTNPTNYNI
jgi:hypothetical protein